MNQLLEKPVGIDKAIEQLQKPLYSRLKKSNDKIIGYGRVQRNRRDKAFVLEYVNGPEPKDIMGGEDSRFYFYMHEKAEGTPDVMAKVDIICMVNLSDFNIESQGKDEYFRAMVAEEIQRSRFKLTGFTTGVEYISSLIRNGFEQTNFPFSGLHPKHAVSFHTEVYYKLKTC